MRKKDIFVGRHPIIEALKNNIPLDKILISKSTRGEEIEQIIQLAKANHVFVQFVPIDKINYLLFPIYQNQMINHQGVVAIAALIDYQSFEDIYNKCMDEGRAPLFLVLDGITDVRNFGAIARSAKCFGVDAIVTTFKNSAMINAESIKVSAGALHTMPICKIDRFEEFFNFVTLCGIKIFEAKNNSKQSIYQADFKVPMALVMGSEEKGISEFVKKYIDESIEIPMSKEFDSLNVSVASGIILAEIFKQRCFSE